MKKVRAAHIVRIVLIAAAVGAIGYVLFLRGPRADHADLTQQIAAAQQVKAPTLAVDSDEQTVQAAAIAQPGAMTAAQVARAIRKAASASHVRVTVKPTGVGNTVSVDATGTLTAVSAFVAASAGAVTLTDTGQLRARGPLLIASNLRIATSAGKSHATFTASHPAG